MNYKAEVRKIQKMNGPELNSYEANLERELQKVESKRQKAEAERQNLFSRKMSAGTIPAEAEGKLKECCRMLSEKKEIERILAYIKEQRMTPAQRKRKVQELKIMLAEI